MAARAKLSDDSLREMLRQGMNGSEIALAMRMTPQAVNQRIARIERKAVAKASPNAVKAVASCWDVKTAAEENYQRAVMLLETECEQAGDKIRAVGEIRQHLQFAMQVIETLYNAQEVKAFMDEVLSVLDECEPGTRDKVLSRLRDRRAIRAAFLPH